MTHTTLKCGACFSDVYFSKHESELLPIPNYCQTCGAKFINALRPLVPASYTCPRCEHTVKNNRLVPQGTIEYCEKCGQSLSIN